MPNQATPQPGRTPVPHRVKEAAKLLLGLLAVLLVSAAELAVEVTACSVIGGDTVVACVGADDDKDDVHVPNTDRVEREVLV